jgi:hypothetical protein
MSKIYPNFINQCSKKMYFPFLVVFLATQPDPRERWSGTSTSSLERRSGTSATCLERRSGTSATCLERRSGTLTTCTGLLASLVALVEAEKDFNLKN